MNRLKKVLWVCCGVLFLGALSAGTLWYATCDFTPAQFWGTDETSFHTIATNGKGDETGPTKDNPVYIEAQAERIYGLHLGSPVKVRFVIKTQRGAKVRFDTLMKGVLSRYTTTWRLYGTPVVVSETSTDGGLNGGFTTWVIEMTVAVWEPPVPPEPKEAPAPADAGTPAGDGSAQPAMSPESAAAAAPAGGAATGAPAPAAAPTGPKELWPFSVEFLYSNEQIANGQPKWEYVETPEIKFGFASLLDPGANLKNDPWGDTLDLGPTGDIPEHLNSTAVALVGFGGLLSLASLGFGFVWFRRWLRKRLAPRPVPEAVIAYRLAIDRAMDTRDVRPFVEQVRVAVRDRLGGASQTDAELTQMWAGHPLHDRIVQVLRILDQAVRVRGRLDTYSEQVVLRFVDELDALQLAQPPGWRARLRTFLSELAKKLPTKPLKGGA